MNTTVRTYETKNNTYYIGYGRTSKTSYEQQQEAKEKFWFMVFQKLVGLIVTIASIILLLMGGIPAVLTLILGIAVTLTNDKVIMI